MRNLCRFLIGLVFAAAASLALAQEEGPPSCMDDMNPGLPQPIVLGVWFGGGTIQYPTADTPANFGPPTMNMFLDWRYDEEEGQIVKTIRTYGGTIAPYIAVGGAASSRSFDREMVKKFVCRIENNTQSWVLYEDYDYQAFSDSEPTGNPNRQSWSRSATDTLDFSAFNPTFVDDDGNVQQNKSKEVLKTYYSSNPHQGPVPIGTASTAPAYPSPPTAVGYARGSDEFTDKWGNVRWKNSYTQWAEDDNPPTGDARSCSFDYEMIGPNLTQSFHRDYDINTGVFNVSLTTNGDKQSGQLIWGKGVTWNYLNLLDSEWPFRQMENLWGQLGFQMLDNTSWLYFWNANPGLESP